MSFASTVLSRLKMTGAAFITFFAFSAFCLIFQFSLKTLTALSIYMCFCIELKEAAKCFYDCAQSIENMRESCWPKQVCRTFSKIQMNNLLGSCAKLSSTTWS